MAAIQRVGKADGVGVGPKLSFFHDEQDTQYFAAAGYAYVKGAVFRGFRRFCENHERVI